MVDVFPDVEEYMLHNFDANGPTIYEKFGFMNLNSYYDESYDYE